MSLFRVAWLLLVFVACSSDPEPDDPMAAAMGDAGAETGACDSFADVFCEAACACTAGSECRYNVFTSPAPAQTSSDPATCRSSVTSVCRLGTATPDPVTCRPLLGGASCEDGTLALPEACR